MASPCMASSWARAAGSVTCRNDTTSRAFHAVARYRIAASGVVKCGGPPVGTGIVVAGAPVGDTCPASTTLLRLATRTGGDGEEDDHHRERCESAHGDTFPPRTLPAACAGTLSAQAG